MYKFRKYSYNLNMKLNKKLIFYILFPLIIGAVVGLITKNKIDYISPSFSPPPILFPIVWSILYIAMGYSSYIISNSVDINRFSALRIYYYQLIINFLWPIIFFIYDLYLISFIVILVLLIFVIVMVIKFYKINKKAGLINVPYVIWLGFASILNFSVYILNK